MCILNSEAKLSRSYHMRMTYTAKNGVTLARGAGLPIRGDR